MLFVQVKSQKQIQEDLKKLLIQQSVIEEANFNCNNGLSEGSKCRSSGDAAKSESLFSVDLTGVQSKWPNDSRKHRGLHSSKANFKNEGLSRPNYDATTSADILSISDSNKEVLKNDFRNQSPARKSSNALDLSAGVYVYQ